LSTEDADDTVAKLEASGFFASVANVDCSTVLPTLASVLAFDVVLVVGDVDFADADLMGDLVADAVDAGVGVVLAVFTTAYPTSLAGRFAADGYFAILGPDSQLDSDGPIGMTPVIPGHALLTGVVTFDGGLASYRPDAGTTVVPGGTLVATWSDTDLTPLIVERDLPTGPRRVDLGLWPVTTDGDPEGMPASSDGMRIVANALLRVGGEL
jgi:hypothetical protein